MRILIILMGFGLWALSAGAIQAQTLKPGDTLSISVLQDPKLDRTVTVDPSGQIAFPLAGHLRARGLTAEQLERTLTARLKDNYKDDRLDVTVAVLSAPKDVPEEDLKPRIFVTGEVSRPGPYVLRQKTTLMQAISLAGGIGPYAAKRRIQVRRRSVSGDEAIFSFDYSAYEAGADIEGNIVLQAGDVIMVPERHLFE
ncbi:polysaccharide biosynthesis/export family protein [Bradyrhizobium sp. Tv2a-2]|uniref:polysaccharide biosynthesis/export family protein n=1 Tax=Bradyrhizobium sp. Tv2a-2 TaxID=113395 RepID=UPI0004157143|nr:polysaccharide biosynthesis/export family protein [Bradyrhizobium sp. Tv2a-2]